MITWLKLVPGWAYWLLALLLVGGVQQYRVNGLQYDLKAERDAATENFGKLSACRETRGNLLVQVGEQNSAIAGLRESGRLRKEKAQVGQADARDQAQADYQAANRLQQERTGGDQCIAAESVIDKELGL
ncbi:hypothetical protein [Stutzerimonas stutzeri]|uniref:hypothetical protein n=1 Tax=Stutzerimonas stutzeri TaxID=316 RepID=UPI0015E4679A|nr:hypothetical protein [Stutzerimonas stutzeri]MBA1278123.1 hypothetical protein [Stutzerimonas stutzeri]